MEEEKRQQAEEDGPQDEGDGQDQEDDIDLDKEMSYIKQLREKISNNTSKVTNILAKK